jgi:SAM-dependent methyltransferase
VQEPPAWHYPDLVRSRFGGVRSLLDLDTGDGERLAALAPLPPLTVATEGWIVNVPRAHRRLRQVGATVIRADEETGNRYGPEDGNNRRRMPLADNGFDLVTNRHGSFAATEVARVLKPGGWLIHQLVGNENLRRLNEELEGQPVSWDRPGRPPPPTLEEAGLEVVEHREDRPPALFEDIGAVVLYLLAVPWAIADFTVSRYIDRLRRLHARMSDTGGLHASGHFHLIVARKPVVEV